MRIGLDGVPLLTLKTGIGKYTYELARALERLPQTPEVRMFYGIHLSGILFRKRHSIAGVSPVANEMTERFQWIPGSLKKWLKLKASKLEYRYHRPDIFHATNYIAELYDIPTVVSLHDLSFLRYPETHPAERIKWLSDNLVNSLGRAEIIIADSEFTRKETISLLGVSGRRIRVVHLGICDSFQPRKKEVLTPVLKPLGLEPGRYILSVGTLEPRKNLLGLLKAFERIPDSVKSQWPLVIVGVRGWKEESITSNMEKLQQKGMLRALGYVPDDKLPFIYSGAALFIYPSFYEGFGLPPLEAMASGVPTVLSNRSSLPEISNGASVLVDPEDSESMANNIESLLEDTEKRRQFTEMGYIQARRFTWRACAEKTYQVYQEVLN